EVASVAGLIAAALATRQDASSVFSRWTPWLMRQVLSHTSKGVADVTSPAFSDDALIDAIGRNLGNCTLPKVSPEDAAPWESWCYRCVLSSFASNGYIPAPAWGGSRDEWCIAPGGWKGPQGARLRECCSLVTNLNTETRGIAANLLAYPIAQSPSARQAWISLWHDTFTLREIVEFGDSDATSDEYGSRSDAGRLLLLLFRIGLAIFDQSAAHCSSSSSF